MSRFNTLCVGDCLYSVLFHQGDSIGSVLVTGFGPCQHWAAQTAHTTSDQVCWTNRQVKTRWAAAFPRPVWDYKNLAVLLALQWFCSVGWEPQVLGKPAIFRIYELIYRRIRENCQEALLYIRLHIPLGYLVRQKGQYQKQSPGL